jgi:biopolymer transport protein ExbD
MRKRKRRAEEAFQMAPMIDMVFLLLVFFMTVSTLAKEARPDTRLPQSDTARVPAEAPPRDILTVIPDGDRYRIFWHNREVEARQLPEILAHSGAATENGELLLRGPPELPWEAWAPVLGSLREAGIADAILATFESP